MHTVCLQRIRKAAFREATARPALCPAGQLWCTRARPPQPPTVLKSAWIWKMLLLLPLRLTTCILILQATGMLTAPPVRAVPWDSLAPSGLHLQLHWELWAVRAGRAAAVLGSFPRQIPSRPSVWHRLWADATRFRLHVQPNCLWPRHGEGVLF